MIEVVQSFPSIANVDIEGPFSAFEGLERILTGIDGKGMILARKIGNLKADLHAPVRFSGSDVIEGLLPDGPIQDFNLIFDATSLNAKVRVSCSNELKTEHTAEPVLTL
jgi:hypothetical protein